MHGSAKRFALKHNLKLERNEAGYYTLDTGNKILVSFETTAKSAIRMMQRYLKSNKG